MACYKIIVTMLPIEAPPLVSITEDFTDLATIKARVRQLLSDWMNDDDTVRFRQNATLADGRVVWAAFICEPEGGDPSDIMGMFWEVKKETAL